jgi:hypothetical protein
MRGWLSRFGGFPTPFRFLILLGKPFNRKSLVWGGESSGMDEYADGIFPHVFEAGQLLIIIAHEVLRLLPFAPAHESPRLLLKCAWLYQRRGM